MEDISTIDTIFIIPKTDKYCNYRINGNSEIRAMTLDNMFQFIMNLSKGTYSKFINDLLYSFQYFIYDVKNNQYHHLQPNIAEQEKEIKKRLKEERFKDVDGIKIKNSKTSKDDSNIWKNKNIFNNFYNKKKLD